MKKLNKHTVKELLVLSTIDYGIFTDLLGNRIVTETHVKNLMVSMTKKYLDIPIYVNDKLQVIDGQHRLAACASLGLPVYYIVYDGWGIEEANILNINNKNWKLTDFVNMYAARGYEEYVKLTGLDEFYGKRYSYSTLLGLMKDSQKSIDGGGRHSTAARKGNLKMGNESHCREVLNTCENINNITGFTKFYNVSFVNAISIVLNKPDFSMNRLMDKIEENKFMVEKRNDYTQYLEMLQEIYNRNSRKKVRFI